MPCNQLIFPSSLLWKEVEEGTDAGTQGEQHSGEGEVLYHYDVQTHAHQVDWTYLDYIAPTLVHTCTSPHTGLHSPCITLIHTHHTVHITVNTPHMPIIPYTPSLLTPTTPHTSMHHHPWCEALDGQIKLLMKCLISLHSAVPCDVTGADGDALQEFSPEELQSALQRVVSTTVANFKTEIDQKLRSSEQGHLNRLAIVEKTVSS